MRDTKEAWILVICMALMVGLIAYACGKGIEIASAQRPTATNIPRPRPTVDIPNPIPITPVSPIKRPDNSYFVYLPLLVKES